MAAIGPASRSGRQIALDLLGRLMGRVEATPDRQNAIIEPVPPGSLLYDELNELQSVLKKAEADGAVELIRGKASAGLSGHIVKVKLLDVEPLYSMLGRRKPADIAAAAAAEIGAKLPGLAPEFGIVLKKMAAEWSRKRNLVRDIAPDDVHNAVGVLRAAMALSGRRRDDGMDIRTFSRRVVGDSKFVEANTGKIADVLRLATLLPEYLDAPEVLEHYGIKKFPHACLLAGPVTYNDTPLPTAPYIGIAPEMTTGLGVSGALQWILTIENLASFNRQVREASGPSGVIVYTGGFPSESTLEAILSLTRASDCPIYHWGDIDVGGIKIAYYLERELARVDRRLALHLMSPELAIKHGKLEKPASIFKIAIDPESAVSDLVKFLGSDAARSLEQEELDPSIPRSLV